MEVSGASMVDEMGASGVPWADRPSPAREGGSGKRSTGTGTQSLSAVTPGQSSVRKGVSGRPSEPYTLQTGLSAQA